MCFEDSVAFIMTCITYTLSLQNLDIEGDGERSGYSQ